MELGTTLFLLNIAVTVIFVIAYVPQLKETYYAKTVKGVSLYFWLLVSLSTSYSLYNLLITGNAEWYVYLGQFINAIVAFILFVWVNKIKFGWGNASVYTLVYVLFNFSLHTLLNLELSQAVATIAIIAAYIDQLLHFYKTKSAEGTNPLLYFFFALGLSLLVVIMVLTQASIHVIITECFNITLLLVCGVWSIILKKERV